MSAVRVGEITAADLVRIADTADIPRNAIRADYSGRYMYGAECVGFDLDSAAQTMLLGAAIFSVLDNDDAVAMMNDTAQDSMGLGIIVYFPRWVCADPENLPADEDEDEDEDW